MTAGTVNPRIPESEVDAVFVDRWSPRAFVNEPLSSEEVASLFEAARWAPSCANEQPWLFLYARSGSDRLRFLSALNERNQLWAKEAPLLVFACCRKNFVKTGKDNRNAAFDTGAAWMSVALQARRLGLYAHGMAGFSVEKVYELTGLDRSLFDVMAAIAIGRHGDPQNLPDETWKNEQPSTRKPAGEVAFEGTAPSGSPATM